MPAEELGKDPLHHDSGRFVDGQGVQPLAVSGLGRVGVRPGVDEYVAVGWPAAEVASFELGLSSSQTCMRCYTNNSEHCLPGDLWRVL
jgi:hypothetical protein